jgi:heme-degrading monooxygenase HmoA
VIARLWQGWTTKENAGAYEDFLREQMFPSMHRVGGFVGVDLLRRDAASGEVEFVTIARFASLEAVREFAGDEYEVAVIEPEARALLARFDEHSRHYAVVVDRA